MLRPVDTSHVQSLKNSLLDATPANVLVLRSVLDPAKAVLAQEYWQLVQGSETGPSQRLAAAALAKLSPQRQTLERSRGNNHETARR